LFRLGKGFCHDFLTLREGKTAEPLHTDSSLLASRAEAMAARKAMNF
jgi:hypothetical protein